MSSPVPVKFGPFDRGLMNGIDPALLPRGAAQTATNLDLSRGTLRGIYTPGSTITSFAGFTQNLRGFAWASDYNWVGDIYDVWSLADYDLTNHVTTTYTNNNVAGTPTEPQRWDNGSSTAQAVGLLPPVGSEINGDITAASNGIEAGLVINKRYAVTYLYGDSANVGLGWESNPVFSAEGGRSTPKQIQVETPLSVDTRVTGRNVYCTFNNDPNGPLYLYHTFTDNTTTFFTDELGTDPTGVALTWLEGGSYEASPYLFDHSPAPVLSLFSDSLHSAVPGITAPGGGIAFAANGKVVRWSQAGNPERWPDRNRWSAPEAVRAILSHLDRTLIFTGSGVYAATGTDDNALRFSKLGAAVGVRAACGKTAQRTPFGVIYLARGGLMLLDGDQSVPLAPDALSADFWDTLAVQATNGAGLLGACYGRHYYVFGGDQTVILDMANGPANLAVSTSDLVITAAHVTPFDGAAYGAGLYVAKAGDRDGSNHPYIRPWMYDQANARGTQAAWVYKSPRVAGINGGPQGLDKRARRLRIRKTGTPTIKVYYDGSLVVNRQLVTTNPDGTTQGEGIDWIQLPAQRWKTLEVQIEGAGASDEVYDFEIDVVPYAA